MQKESIKTKIKFDFEIEVETKLNGMWLHTQLAEGTLGSKKFKVEDIGTHFIVAETIEKNNWLSHCISKEKLLLAIVETILKQEVKLRSF